jgi:putative transposase
MHNIRNTRDNNIMDNKYRRTKTTVSMLNYHFVFCPRYRRKIFKIQGVEDRFKEITTDRCNELGIEIVAMECHINHAHLFLNALPSIAPSDIMHRIKGASSAIIRKEFPQLAKMPSLWTRNYFVSNAGNTSSETVKKYVDEQKTR